MRLAEGDETLNQLVNGGGSRLHFRDGAALAVGVAAMSTASILIRLAQEEGVASIAIAAYRLGVAAAAVSVAVTRQRTWKEYAKLAGADWILMIISGLLLGTHFATWITSLEYTTVMSSVVLVSTTPIWIGLLAPIIVRERTPRMVWISIAVSTAGAIIIGGNWPPTTTLIKPGDLLALVGAVVGAAYLLIGKRARDLLTLAPYLFLVYGMAGITLAALAVLSRIALTGHSLRAYLLLLGLGLIPQLVGHSAANYAIRRLPATTVGIAVLGEPVGSTLLALIILNEMPTGLQLAGGVVILAGIILVSLTQGRETQPAKAALPSDQSRL